MTRDALDRLMPDMDGEGVRNADLDHRGGAGKARAQAEVYAALEPKMKPGAILATNTSSIPLQDLRTTLQQPERLVGLHFFNPVSRLQLVEVVSHDRRRTMCCAGRWALSAPSTGCRCRSRARRAFSSTAR